MRADLALARMWIAYICLVWRIVVENADKINNFKDIKKGMHNGIPIALGYISVSFTFGIMGVNSGLFWWQTLLISMVNLTSAGQFAGLGIMVSAGSFVEMALTQFVINLRYALMSVSLAQKADKAFNTIARLLTGFGITDEIFAVAVGKNRTISKYYMTGLIIIPYIGWAAGTAAGALLGEVIPQVLSSALGIAIYGMFMAIIIPQARDNYKCLVVIIIAIVLSCCFKYIPFINNISSGFAIIICAVCASFAGAVLYPVEDKEE